MVIMFLIKIQTNTFIFQMILSELVRAKGNWNFGILDEDQYV